MKAVYLNGQYLVPDGVIGKRGQGHSSSNMDFYFRRGRLFFEFTLKGGDIIAIVRTFLGITWSNRYYKISNYKKVPANTPLRLGRRGEVVAEGLVTTLAAVPKNNYKVA